MSSTEWEAAIARFRASMDAAGVPRSQATRETYARHVTWLASSSTSGPWELSSGDLMRWLDGQHWSADTRRKVVVSLRAFYAAAVRAGDLEWAPTAAVAARVRRVSGPEANPVPAAWRQPLDGFAASLRAGGRSEGTVSVYLCRLGWLAAVAADPWAVTSAQLEAWLANDDWSPETKRGGRTTLRSFYSWAIRAGHTTTSPAADLPAVKVPRALPRPAPEEALHSALARSDDRTRLAIMLAAYAGLRRSEIAGLHTNQISDTEVLVVGKGGHHRIVPIDPAGDLASELRAEMARRRRGDRGSGWPELFTTADGYLFPSDKHPGPITAKHLGRLIAQALPDDLAAHTLRHRFATKAYAAQRDLMAVQQLLGHARPETTAVYARVPDGALIEAVKGASGPRW